MKNIVKIENNEAKVSLVDVAVFSGVQKRAIVRTIRNNAEAFGRFGHLRLAKESTNIGVLLNEAETTFLLTLLKNTKEVVKFKSDLVYQFYKMREQTCNANQIQLDSKEKQLFISQKNLKEAQSNNRKIYKDGFMSLNKYLQDNDIPLNRDEAFDILYKLDAIEYKDVHTIRRVLKDETFGRQTAEGVIEFNSRALDSVFAKYVIRTATLFDEDKSK